MRSGRLKAGEMGRSQIVKGLRYLMEELELYPEIYTELLKFKQENGIIGFEF